MTVPLIVRTWHPAYRQRPELPEWLENDEPELVLPVSRQPRMPPRGRLEPEDAVRELPRLLLVKRYSVGEAPYVGEPVWYVWAHASDQYGRTITAPAIRVHDLGEWAEWKRSRVSRARISRTRPTREATGHPGPRPG